ncbi:MAG TPA: hydrogenase iron-sulfur subunit [Candidatus Deferrimicrobium sp.]|nr:hydrogenase iron-sulfur subunit [Candidatus Deferrimicrobium sp.]
MFGGFPDRIGVFICQCGKNIAEVINLDEVIKEVQTWDKVITVKSNTFMCSLPGQNLLKKMILEHSLNKIVIAACSLRVHKKMFQIVLEDALLNPYLLEIANIREQCSWVNAEDPEKATRKVVSLIRGAVKKVEKLYPLENIRQAVKKQVLIVGGGIAGITAAISLAKTGYTIFLSEKDYSIGGNMVKLVKTYPEEECAMCTISPLMSEVAQNPNITLLTGAEPESIEGSIGNFRVILKQNPRYIDINKCLTCGNCAEVCPVEIPDEWNCFLGTRKAIYRSFPEAVPSAFIINPNHCLYLKSRQNNPNTNTAVCQKCMEACIPKAINFDDKPQMHKFKVGSIIVATGHKDYDPSKKPHLGYKRFPNVITIMQLARLLDINGPTRGKLINPANNKRPKSVLFLQCVGSRDEKPSGHQYCSQVCCMSAIKYASMIKKFDKSIEVTISYTDIRAVGFYEQYYKYVQNQDVHFIRGKVSDVSINPETGALKLQMEDTLTSEFVIMETDLLVLSTALEPSLGTIEVANTFGLLMTEDGFIKEDHLKLRPINTNISGIFACGTALGPKDITASVLEANSATAKVEEILKQGIIQLSPDIAVINPNKCNNCGICLNLCPYNAFEKMNERILINSLACTGCGACVPECPQKALDVNHLTIAQLKLLIEGILQDTKNEDRPIIIAFLESKIAYAAADDAGIKKLQYPANIRIIQVPSTAMIPYDILKFTFDRGADGIFLGEGPEEGPVGKAAPIVAKRIDKFEKQLEKDGIDSSHLYATKIYINEGQKLTELFKTFTQILEEEQ